MSEGLKYLPGCCLTVTLLRKPSKPSQNMVIMANDRFHHQAEAKMKAKLREIARSVPMNGQQPYNEQRPCDVLVKVYPPTNRNYDPPNVSPTIKALIDGLTDAGLWTDDNFRIIRRTSFEHGGSLSGTPGHYRFEIQVEDVNEN